MDDIRKKGKPDINLIRLEQPREIEYWETRLQKPKDEIQTAIDVTGSHAVRIIRPYLKKL